MTVEQELSKNPIIGVIGAIVAGIAPYIDVLTAVGQFIAVWIGVVVVSATAYIKTKEAINIYRNRKKQ